MPPIKRSTKPIALIVFGVVCGVVLLGVGASALLNSLGEKTKTKFTDASQSLIPPENEESVPKEAAADPDPESDDGVGEPDEDKSKMSDEEAAAAMEALDKRFGSGAPPIDGEDDATSEEIVGPDGKQIWYLITSPERQFRIASPHKFSLDESLADSNPDFRGYQYEAGFPNRSQFFINLIRIPTNATGRTPDQIMAETNQALARIGASSGRTISGITELDFRGRLGHAFHETFEEGSTSTINLFEDQWLTTLVMYNEIDLATPASVTVEEMQWILDHFENLSPPLP